MKPAILLRRRLDGTTAFRGGRGVVSYGRGGEGRRGEGWMGLETYDFIDDTFIGVKVECKAGIAISYESSINEFSRADRVERETNYFSMRTREALLVVLVRTRPYNSLVST